MPAPGASPRSKPPLAARRVGARPPRPAPLRAARRVLILTALTSACGHDPGDPPPPAPPTVSLIDERVAPLAIDADPEPPFADPASDPPSASTSRPPASLHELAPDADLPTSPTPDTPLAPDTTPPAPRPLDPLAPTDLRPPALAARDPAALCDRRCRGGDLDGDDLLAPIDHEHGLRDTWEPTDLIALDPPYVIPEGSPPNLLRAEAARAFVALSDAAHAATGVRINIRSGYRPFDLQCGIFRLELARSGCDEAARSSARAGHSEHQLGTTVDIAIGWRRLDGLAPVDAYLAAHAHEHGWVLSFPEGSEPVTGVKHEPWHYRYLGPAAAADLVARSGPARRLSILEYLARSPRP